jgi:hypothetical protein
MNRIKACFVLLLGAIVVMPARAQEAKPVPDRKEIYKTVCDVTLNVNVFLPDGFKAGDKAPGTRVP